MTPVLVFLTNKTLYVTDLVRNRLCNKFVLPYSELDVILVSVNYAAIVFKMKLQQQQNEINCVFNRSDLMEIRYY